MSVEGRKSSGDLRKLAKSMKLATKDVRALVAKVMHEIQPEIKRDLKRRTSQSRTTARGVRGRSGELSESADMYVDREKRPYTVISEFGFFATPKGTHPRGMRANTAAAAAVTTGNTKYSTASSTVLKPRNSKFLAYPVEDAPSDIRDGRGVQLKTLSEARQSYVTKTIPIAPAGGSGKRFLVVGYKRGTRKPKRGKWPALFIMAQRVRVPVRIKLPEYEEQITRKIDQALGF